MRFASGDDARVRLALGRIPGAAVSGASRRRSFGLTVACVVLALAAIGCGSPSTAGESASASGAQGSVAATLTSPVTGVLTKIDSQGLTKVTGFRLRTADGVETAFTIGLLENGAQFPPGHLAEHMATSTPVKVWFRAEGGSLVVYRLEDG